MNLTERQKQIYSFIEEYSAKHKRSPSYEEIRAHFGFHSYNAVFKHVRALEERGFIRTLGKNRKRSLEPVSMQPSAVSIPLAGVVAAGAPIEPVEVPDTIDVPENLLGSGVNIALRVRGDSMIEDGIRSGDILIVSRQQTVHSGQTAVVLVEGDATVKRIHLHADTVELRPANSELRPVFAPAASVEVVGVVVGLFRDYRDQRK